MGCGVVILFALLMALTAAYDQDYCYANEENPYLMFATKTAYEFVYERKRGAEVVPYCEPIQLWLLVRHGTRYPDRENIAEMQQLPELRDQILRNHESRHKGRLCHDDLEALRNWVLEVFPNQASDLANQGYDEQKFLARRLKTRFPTLLNKTYSQDKFEFRFTDTERTKASAIAFSEGMFGSHYGVYFPPAMKNDTLIKSYGNCTTWQDQVDDNNDTLHEKHLFQRTIRMQNLVQNVSERLGFGYRLSFKQLDLMYDMCRFDKAWKVKENSPWCAVFSKDELKLMEYAEDLEYYYHSGYGNELNIKLGCPTVKDFMDHFSQLESKGQGEPAGIFYFTHSSMIQMTVARLGIHKDRDPLTHSNYESMKTRQWKTSTITPFASNLAVVFWKCDIEEKHRVMFFLGERLVNYEGCNVGLCDWSYIREKLGSIAEECNLDFCHRGYNTGTRVVSYLWLFVISVIIASYQHTVL